MNNVSRETFEGHLYVPLLIRRTKHVKITNCKGNM